MTKLLLIIAFVLFLYRKNPFSLLALPILVAVWFLSLLRDKIEDREIWLAILFGTLLLLLTEVTLAFHLFADYFDNLLNNNAWDTAKLFYYIDEYKSHYYLFLPSSSFFLLAYLLFVSKHRPNTYFELVVYNIFFGLALMIFILGMVEGHLVLPAILFLTIALFGAVSFYKKSYEQIELVRYMSLLLGGLIGIYLALIFLGKPHL